ncbi:MAG: Kdo domain containing protein [Methyloprofundus sp.]|nr:Kdo domain containing protein [Methyloprofundus sp.]
MKIVVAPNYKLADIQQFLENIQAQGKVEYQGRNTIKSLRVADQNWNVKIFRLPHLINAIVYRYFRASKAQRSFDYAHILLDKGFNTPCPIAYAEQRSFWRITHSYYISEHIESDLSLHTLKMDIDYPDRTNILQQFIEFTYHLQMSGIYFMDHSPGNTLIVKQSEGQYRFYLVDLNRIKFGPLSYQTRIKNFTRLSATDEMLEIMAEKYAQLCGSDFQQTYADILKACHTVAAKRTRKQQLKKKFLG